MECIVFEFLFSFKALGYQMPLSLTLVLSYAALNILYLMSQGKTLKQYADMASQGDQHPMLLRARLAPPTTTEIDTASAQVYEAREKAEAGKAAAAEAAAAASAEAATAAAAATAAETTGAAPSVETAMGVTPAAAAAAAAAAATATAATAEERQEQHRVRRR